MHNYQATVFFAAAFLTFGLVDFIRQATYRLGEWRRRRAEIPREEPPPMQYHHLITPSGKVVRWPGSTPETALANARSGWFRDRGEAPTRVASPADVLNDLVRQYRGSDGEHKPRLARQIADLLAEHHDHAFEQGAA